MWWEREIDRWPPLTEAEWLAASDPRALLVGVARVQPPGWDRKLRLFACACWRQIGHLVGDPFRQAVLDVAERYADGQAGVAELASVRRGSMGVAAGTGMTAAWYAAQAAEWRLADSLQRARTPFIQDWKGWPPSLKTWLEVGREVQPVAQEQLHSGQCDLLREIFGNPFRPCRCNPVWRAWNDGCAVRIARTIYDERRFGELPIFADALLDAGCDSEEMLEHCRAARPHVRGCWALDLVLGTT